MLIFLPDSSARAHENRGSRSGFDPSSGPIQALSPAGFPPQLLPHQFIPVHFLIQAWTKNHFRYKVFVVHGISGIYHSKLLLLPAQEAFLAVSFALPSAGISMAARSAMIAITTRSSINVKLRFKGLFILKFLSLFFLKRFKLIQKKTIFHK